MCIQVDPPFYFYCFSNSRASKRASERASELAETLAFSIEWQVMRKLNLNLHLSLDIRARFMLHPQSENAVYSIVWHLENKMKLYFNPLSYLPEANF